MTNRHASTMVMIVVLFLITLEAQDRQFRRDPLRYLAPALKHADATDLTLTQQAQLLIVLKEFRETQVNSRPGPEMHEARQVYQDGILTLNIVSAETQAGVIANKMATSMRSRLEAEARFKIGVLKILSEDQTELLSKRNGTTGLFQLLGP